MAMPSARSIGVGAFVLGGVLLFSLALFLVGNRRMLFADSFRVYAEFKAISGVQVGSGVRVAGMVAGEVKDIDVPSNPDGRFRLELQVREELHGLVRTDSVATIQTEGLVGAEFVQIGAGTAGASRVRDSGTILSREPFEFTDLLQQMSDTVVQVNTTIVVLRDRLDQTMTTIQQAASNADALIKSVSSDVSAISTSSARLLSDASRLLEMVRSGKGTMGRLFTDDELYRNLSKAVTDAQKTVASVRQFTDQLRDAMQGGGQGGQVAGLTASVNETLDKARESMSNLADATEALKHNFLLRGYFNRRGYFNLSDITVQDYREGVLEKNGRRALRVWIAASVLFARDARGSLVLTDEGRARLESAMAEFLPYRRSGPLMVEGYAEGADTATRFLAARERAAAVRAFLLARFTLDPATTGLIALGDSAKGSPSGDGWDGVALAIFLPPDALTRQGEE